LKILHVASAWVPYETVFPYIGNKEKFLLTSRLPRGFKEAIEAMEDAIKNMTEEVLLKKITNIVVCQLVKNWLN